jgi:hypothetical protein
VSRNLKQLGSGHAERMPAASQGPSSFLPYIQPVDRFGRYPPKPFFHTLDHAASPRKYVGMFPECFAARSDRLNDLQNFREFPYFIPGLLGGGLNLFPGFFKKK